MEVQKCFKDEVDWSGSCRSVEWIETGGIEPKPE